MSRITVSVRATVGSDIGSLTGEPRRDAYGRGRPEGWPVGRGEVDGTLGGDGLPVDALVLMREPAVPGEVRAWPVAVLHLDEQGRAGEEVVCVAEDLSFADLADLPDLGRWQTEPEVWVAALHRLRGGTAPRMTGCGPRAEAERELAEAERAFWQLTGCLE